MVGTAGLQKNRAKYLDSSYHRLLSLFRAKLFPKIKWRYDNGHN